MNGFFFLFIFFKQILYELDAERLEESARETQVIQRVNIS